MNAKRGDPLSPILLVTEWSLDMATDTVESTALGDNNKTYIQGLKDLKGSISGFWNALDDLMFEASDSPTGIDLLIYPSTLSPLSFAGPAWLNVSIKGGVSAGVTLDGSFVANGSWTRSSGGAAARVPTPGTVAPGTTVMPTPGPVAPAA